MGTIRAELHGAVATLVIDNPDRRNAMTADMHAAVPAAVERIRADDDIRVVVMRGEGTEAFGAGSDISEFPDRRMGAAAADYDELEHSAWSALADLAVPVVAAIQGPCMGGGIAMALHADIRVASTDATFAVPPARLGIAYPVDAVRRLERLVGPGQAMRLLCTARVIDGAEAHRIGLVDELVATADFADHLARLETTMTRLAPLSLRAAKATVRAAAFDAARAPEAHTAVAACYESADFREGVDAFLDKRHARFAGR